MGWYGICSCDRIWYRVLLLTNTIVLGASLYHTGRQVELKDILYHTGEQMRVGSVFHRCYEESQNKYPSDDTQVKLHIVGRK